MHTLLRQTSDLNSSHHTFPPVRYQSEIATQVAGIDAAVILVSSATAGSERDVRLSE